MDFNESEIRRVWNKARLASNNDSRLWRVDDCGAWIYWYAYGNRDSIYGWEIDHKIPVARGGSDLITNLRPLHWKNNAAKQDNNLSCVVIASGITNVYRT